MEDKPWQFKKGNQFWRKRGKHGRDAIVQSEALLAETADEYFSWCVDNPILQRDIRGKDNAQVIIEHPRPFKKHEFARWCGLSEWRLVTDLKAKSDDFSQVVTHIATTIYDQKYDHAVCGMYNAVIIARDLGLSDNVKSEVTNKDQKITVTYKENDTDAD